MSISEQEILQLAREYGAHFGLKLSTIGTYAVNDGKFFGRLEQRGSCTVRTSRIVLSWFSEIWPDADLVWPAGIARPALSGSGAPKKKDAA